MVLFCVLLGRQGSRSCGYFNAKVRGSRRTAKSDRSNKGALFYIHLGGGVEASVNLTNSIMASLTHRTGPFPAGGKPQAARHSRRGGGEGERRSHSAAEAAAGVRMEVGVVYGVTWKTGKALRKRNSTIAAKCWSARRRRCGGWLLAPTRSSGSPARWKE